MFFDTEGNPLEMPEYGLIVGGKWVYLILADKKPWELRKGLPNRRVNGDFGLIPKGTKTVAGVVALKSCKGPLTLEELLDNRKKIHETRAEIVQDHKDHYVFAWVLNNPRTFEKPVAYNHPSGAVTWVRLTGRVPSANAAACAPS